MTISGRTGSSYPLLGFGATRLAYLGFRPFLEPSQSFYSFRRLDCFDDLERFDLPAHLLGEAAIRRECCENIDGEVAHW